MGELAKQRTSSAAAERSQERCALDEARLRSLASRDDAIELVVRADDGAVVEANEGAARAYGYEREALLRLSVADLGALETRAELVAHVAAARGSALRLEAEHRRRDGTSFPVEIGARSFQAGDTVYLHWLVRDLGEQRRREHEALAAQHALATREARALADEAPVFVWTAGPDGRRSWFNRPWLDFTGQGEAQAWADGWVAGVHPDDRGRCLEVQAASLATRTPFVLEYRLRRADGSYRAVRDSATPRFGDAGAFAGFVGYALDLTERIASQEALRRLAAAVEQTPASIVISDANGVVEYVNPAFERTTGYPRAEAIGRPASLVKSGVHPPGFYADLWATIGAGRVWNGRIVNRARDGRLVTEDAVIAPVKDARGAIRNYVAVKRDVTTELALEQQLSEARRLDGIAALAGGIAHDFNNLLTVILSCAEDLKAHAAEGRGAGPEPVEAILAASERARDLTRKLLAFARRQVIEPVPLDLSARARDALRLLRRVIPEDISLVTKLEAGLWSARLDPAQLEQVILNLAVNSRDAMPGGGTLTLETANVDAGEAEVARFPGLRPGAYVRLAVRDTGAGMSSDVRARAFEPFFTTKPPGRGTGLGLATVHGIVKQSGGFIRVESERGEGTCVHMLFPRCAEAPARVAPARAAGTSGGTEAVLVVEDDPHVREVTVRALRSGGYAVSVAGDGRCALGVLEREGGGVDLVVTDVVMPGMDGAQLAEQVRARWPGTAVLFVSGHAHEVLASRGVEPGRVPLLAKPYAAAALLACVRAVLDGRRETGRASG